MADLTKNMNDLIAQIKEQQTKREVLIKEQGELMDERKEVIEKISQKKHENQMTEQQKRQKQNTYINEMIKDKILPRVNELYSKAVQVFLQIESELTHRREGSKALDSMVYSFACDINDISATKISGDNVINIMDTYNDDYKVSTDDKDRTVLTMECETVFPFHPLIYDRNLHIDGKLSVVLDDNFKDCEKTPEIKFDVDYQTELIKRSLSDKEFANTIEIVENIVSSHLTRIEESLADRADVMYREMRNNNSALQYQNLMLCDTINEKAISRGIKEAIVDKNEFEHFINMPIPENDKIPYADVLSHLRSEINWQKKLQEDREKLNEKLNYCLTKSLTNEAKRLKDGINDKIAPIIDEVVDLYRKADLSIKADTPIADTIKNITEATKRVNNQHNLFVYHDNNAFDFTYYLVNINATQSSKTDSIDIKLLKNYDEEMFYNAKSLYDVGDIEIRIKSLLFDAGLDVDEVIKKITDNALIYKNYMIEEKQRQIAEMAQNLIYNNRSLEEQVAEQKMSLERDQKELKELEKDEDDMER